MGNSNVALPWPAARSKSNTGSDVKKKEIDTSKADLYQSIDILSAVNNNIIFKTQAIHQRDCFHFSYGNENNNVYLAGLSFDELKHFIDCYFRYSMNDKKYSSKSIYYDIIDIIFTYFDTFMYRFRCLDSLFSKMILFNRINNIDEKHSKYFDKSSTISANQFIFAYDIACDKLHYCSHCLQIGFFEAPYKQIQRLINEFATMNQFTHSKFHQLLTNKHFTDTFGLMNAYYITFEYGIGVSTTGFARDLTSNIWIGHNTNYKCLRINEISLTKPKGILKLTIRNSATNRNDNALFANTEAKKRYWEVTIEHNKDESMLNMETIHVFQRFHGQFEFFYNAINRPVRLQHWINANEIALLPAIAVTGCDLTSNAGFNFLVSCVHAKQSHL